MGNVTRFLNLLIVSGSDAVFHREEGGTPCPCQTPEGYRSPKWHIDHPLAEVCNEAGILPGTVTNIGVKAFVHPAQSAAVRRLTSEYINAMFGEVQGDDHIGIFPITWSGTTLDFLNWSQAGEDFVMYDSRRYLVVNANKIPDPADGNENHHWEVGLRLMKTARPV
jgi:hypothetical protein